MSLSPSGSYLCRGYHFVPISFVDIRAGVMSLAAVSAISHLISVAPPVGGVLVVDCDCARASNSTGLPSCSVCSLFPGRSVQGLAVQTCSGRWLLSMDTVSSCTSICYRRTSLKVIGYWGRQRYGRMMAVQRLLGRHRRRFIPVGYRSVLSAIP